MPTYNYACDKGCMANELPDMTEELKKSKTFVWVKSERLVWEEKHKMLEDPEIKCPACGKKASKTMEGVGAPIFWTRGNCYLNKDDCRRQMDLHKMETGQDPYAGMRQPGEADHIKKKLKNWNKSKPKYFTT